MRTSLLVAAVMLLLVAAVIFVSCDHADPPPRGIVIRVREPQRVNGCNVYIEAIYDDHWRGKPIREVRLQTICGVPESTLKGKWWWGDGLQPPGFNLYIGDCMPLEDVYYCLEDLVHYESATFRPTYIKPEHRKGELRLIRNETDFARKRDVELPSPSVAPASSSLQNP